MEALWHLGSETALHIVVHTKISFDNVSEISHNFVGILVQKSLQLAHFFVVVEVLFILRIELHKDVLVVLKGLNELLSTPLLGQIGRLLQLIVFLLESVVELGQFDLHIVLDIFLLISDYLEDLIFELLLTLLLKFFEFVKH